MAQLLSDCWWPFPNPALAEELRGALETAMARDPGDIAARFPALNCFFRLAYYSWAEQKEEVIRSDRATLKGHLAETAKLSTTTAAERLLIGRLVMRYVISTNADSGFPSSPENIDRLHEAIACLEKALYRGPLHPVYRAMLARCYFATGKFDPAAQEYRALLKEPYRPIPPPEGDFIAERDYRVTALALEKAGRIPEAIQILEQLLQDFPNSKRVYYQIAELERKRGAPDRACELLEKECEMDPSFDTGAVSVPLAMGRIRLDQIRVAPDVERVVAGSLRAYWPAFRRLSQASRNEWVKALWLQYSGQVAVWRQVVATLASVVEQELRSRVFEPYCKQIRQRGTGWEALPRDKKRACELRAYLEKGKTPGLGVMFWLLQSLEEPSLNDYAHWLRGNFPKFDEELRRLDTRKITSLRDRIHKIYMEISQPEAEEAADQCRQVIELLLRCDRGDHSPPTDS